jgi:ABC-type Mn2+/Zn2+ transport system ATPase subunit
MLKEIKFENVSFSFREKVILSEVNFHLGEGEKEEIIGQNGTGKTTLFRLLLRQLKPQKGVVTNTFRNIAYISQVTSTGKDVVQATVKEILSLGLSGKGFFFPKEEKERLAMLSEFWGLTPFLSRPLQDLSGGQQQKVRFALAFLKRPDLYLLDEADAGLDDETKLFLRTQLAQDCQKRGTALLFISHTDGLILPGTLFYELRDGKLERKEI